MNIHIQPTDSVVGPCCFSYRYMGLLLGLDRGQNSILEGTT
jgi:hypothetical protein